MNDKNTIRIEQIMRNILKKARNTGKVKIQKNYAKQRLNEQKYEIEQRDLKKWMMVYITINICDGNTVKRIMLLI